LQSRGLRTLLIDPADEPRGASWGNAGHIATEQVEPLASSWAIRSVPKRLFWRGGALSLPLREIATWLPFSRMLLAASRPARFAAGRGALSAVLAQAMEAWRRLLIEAGAADLLHEAGHYVLWESDATAAEGLRRWNAAEIGTAEFRRLTDIELSELRALIPAPIAGGIRFSGSGHIADTGVLAETLARHFGALGGERRRATVVDVTKALGRASLRLDDGTTVSAKAIVIAAGARSAALMRPFGHEVPLIAERGYHLQSAETDWPAEMPPVVFEDRSMIVTRFRSGLRAASFVEFGRIDSPADPRKWARLRRHVAQLGFTFRMPGVEWMGARPTLPDYLPAIGRSRGADNLFYAFGHQHLGLTLAAVTGEAMAALVTGEAPAFDITPFDLDRFGAIS
jgi:D-amino-acid dehydrogenase